MKTISLARLFVILASATAAGAAGAADFDGSENMLCAVQEVRSCMPFSECEQTPPDTVGVPDFLEVEFDKKQISDTLDNRDERKTGIERQKITKTGLYLQGHEDYAWTMAIARKSGRFSLTAIESDYAFVIFGACTIP